MTFASMHNDYLDPDRHLWPAEDYGFDAVLAALKKRDTGRWRWDGIDCSWTGKDADLEPWGQQGAKLLSVGEEHATVEVRAYKTFVGDDVSLNVPKHAENNLRVYKKVRDIYMEQATEIVCGCGSAGEWDGDSWGMTYCDTIKVPVVLTGDESEVDAEKTADAILALAEKSLADWERKIAVADEAMDVLAGWKAYTKDDKLVSCKPGRPGPGSAWAMYKSQQ